MIFVSGETVWQNTHNIIKLWAFKSEVNVQILLKFTIFQIFTQPNIVLTCYHFTTFNSPTLQKNINTQTS